MTESVIRVPDSRHPIVVEPVAPHWAARAIENHVAFDPAGIERIRVPRN